MIIGSTEPIGNTISCFCVDQMRNIISQITTLYPNDNLIVAMESGNNASGRPGSLINPNSGLFQLINNQGVPEEALSLCRIASITITSAHITTLLHSFLHLPHSTNRM